MKSTGKWVQRIENGHLVAKNGHASGGFQPRAPGWRGHFNDCETISHPSLTVHMRCLGPCSLSFHRLPLCSFFIFSTPKRQNIFTKWICSDYYEKASVSEA